MKKYFVSVAALLFGTSLGGNVWAETKAIAYQSITTIATSETFESYPVGPTLVSDFNGFSVSFEDSGRVSIYSDYYCESQCLINRDEIWGARRLLNFSKGTKKVGFTLDSFWRLGYPEPRTDLPDVFVIKVQGNSGSLEITQPITKKEWFAFEDDAGLLEISVLTKGSASAKWNFSFDDVITSAVPEVSALQLAGCGLLIVGAFRTRRRPR